MKLNTVTTLRLCRLSALRGNPILMRDADSQIALIQIRPASGNKYRPSQSKQTGRRGGWI